MARRVLKFGGKSLSSTDKIKAIASQVKTWKDQGDEIVIVVSAMGDTTNQLMQLASTVSSKPSQRELDMLVSTGERVSMSLMSIALIDLGCEAISFTGSQAGILTDSHHSGAKIVEVKATRVLEELENFKIVVLAGFQGVCPQTKEVTTLGRGGTDTTAVAIADFIGAESCEMFKDVDGVSNIDPKLWAGASLFPLLNYDQALKMCRSGAKIIHPEAIEWAKKSKIEILVKKAHGASGQGTRIASKKMQPTFLPSISHSDPVYEVFIHNSSLSPKVLSSSKQFYDLELILAEQKTSGIQILIKGGETKLEFYISWLASKYSCKTVSKSLVELQLLGPREKTGVAYDTWVREIEITPDHRKLIFEKERLNIMIEKLAPHFFGTNLAT